MRFYEVRAFYDPQRVIGWYATTEKPSGKIEQSHGMTYLEARKAYQDMGDVMGLEKILEDDKRGA